MAQDASTQFAQFANGLGDPTAPPPPTPVPADQPDRQQAAAAPTTSPAADPLAALKILRNVWDYPHILENAGAIEDYSLLRSKLEKVSSAFSYLRHAPADASPLRKAGALALHQLF